MSQNMVQLATALTRGSGDTTKFVRNGRPYTLARDNGPDAIKTMGDSRRNSTMGILLDRHQRILHRTKHRSRWWRINPLPLRLARILTLRPKLGQNLVARTIACDYLNREESKNVVNVVI